MNAKILIVSVYQDTGSEHFHHPRMYLVSLPTQYSPSCSSDFYHYWLILPNLQFYINGFLQHILNFFHLIFWKSVLLLVSVFILFHWQVVFCGRYHFFCSTIDEHLNCFHFWLLWIKLWAFLYKAFYGYSLCALKIH